MRRLVLTLAAVAFFCTAASARELSFRAGRTVTYSIESSGAPVVGAALDMFRSDLHSVLGSDLKESARPSIVIKTLPEGGDDPLSQRPQGFRIEARGGHLLVTGADDQGTAYGIMELSRMLGVSPWEWWADCTPKRLAVWTVPENYLDEQSPAVLYRGIFINDEDSGFCPWAWKTDDPSETEGRIGPKTHERLFQLLLRLRANTFWPAIHSCSVPFYMTEGNREAAEKYNITIGTSHCEPMLSNTNGEWNRRGVGEYNFITNRENVLSFWEQRVKETAGANGFYTVGMRGIHDTGMLGVGEDLDERREALENVIAAQRSLLEKHVNGDLSKVLQALIPYKEVLPIYNSGLKVPSDVTLIWCDDNYGYIRHFPTPEEKARSGGNGLYYHVSYYGRPNATTWIQSYSPALVHEELERAYDEGIRKLWVFNVGDLKPNEYLMEYCLDLAWDSDLLHENDCTKHLSSLLAREFGDAVAARILPPALEYFRLIQEVKPEFLGHSRVEEYAPLYATVTDLPWTDAHVAEILSRCETMEQALLEVEDSLSESDRTRLFELFGFNVSSYAAMARKMLGAQLARHGRTDWTVADSGDDRMAALAERYQTLKNGKWANMFGFSPGATHFKPLEHRTCEPPHIAEVSARFVPSDGSYGEHCRVIPQLGHSAGALNIAEGEWLEIEIPPVDDPSVLTLAFIPVHPTSPEGSLGVTVAIDGEKYETEVFTAVQYQTTGRSEEWKTNIETGQARRSLPLNASPQSRRLRIIADTPGVIIDEITVSKANR